MSLMTAGLSNQIPTVLTMLGIICIIGIIGNLLVIIVYSIKHENTTANLFILILAISDFLACMTLIPGTMWIEYLEWNINSTFLCKFYYLINNTFIPFSSLLITSIAFDRYFCLCHPFKQIMTLLRAKILIIIEIFICSLLGLSSTFIIRIEPIRQENYFANTTVINQSKSKQELFNNTKINNELIEKFECAEVVKINSTVIDRILYQIVQKSQTLSYILCILSVTILYILIYRSVSKVFKKRLELKGIHNHRSTDNNSLKFSKLTKKIKQKFTNSKNSLYIFNDSNLNKSSNSVKHQNSKSNTINIATTATSSMPTFSPSTALLTTTTNSRQTGEIPDPNLAHNINNNNNDNNLEQFSLNQNISINVLKSTEISINLVENKISTSLTTNKNNNNNNLSIKDDQFLNGKSKKSLKTIKDHIAFQNLKTAAMLFVVAVVYILTFIPAMLMATQSVPLYLPIFYLYYINNAINPIIYGFMNPNFRADIQLLFCNKN